MTTKNKCTECGSNDIRWHSGIEKTSPITDGRLCGHDVKPIFYLGCEYCSATLKIIGGDEVAQKLDEISFV